MARKPVAEEREVSRKPSRRESRDVSAHLWSIPCAFLCKICRTGGPRVPAGTRLSLRPLLFERGISGKNSDASRREIAEVRTINAKANNATKF